MASPLRFTIVSLCGLAVTLPLSGCVATRPYAALLCILHGGFPGAAGDYCAIDRDRRGRADAVPVGGGRVDPFVARLKARTVSRGRIRGRRATGIRTTGTIRISPRGAPRRLLRGYTKARFASSGGIRVGGSNGLGRLEGYMWLTFPRGRGAACIRVDAQAIGVEGPPSAVAQFRSLGGTGRAARLGVVGSAPLNAGATRVTGTWQVRRAKARRAPAACRRLARLR